MCNPISASQLVLFPTHCMTWQNLVWNHQIRRRRQFKIAPTPNNAVVEDHNGTMFHARPQNFATFDGKGQQFDQMILMDDTLQLRLY